eukprot:scaffold1959_cov243-Pinguiococcus_pyrenoidosus.AAC.9
MASSFRAGEWLSAPLDVESSETLLDAERRTETAPLRRLKPPTSLYLKYKHFIVGILAFVVLVIVAVSVESVATSNKGQSSKEEEVDFPSLGDYNFPFECPGMAVSEKLQRLVSTGILQQYAYNQPESQKLLQQAVEMAPECATVRWALAYALGPFANYPVLEPAEVQRAHDAAQAAVAALRPEEAGTRASFLANAIAARYPADPEGDQAQGAADYVEAMKAAYDAVKDPDVAAVYAEALMMIHPGKYYLGDGSQRQEAVEAEAILEHWVKGEGLDHPMLHHLYIHVTEEGAPGDKDGAGRGEHSADRLAAGIYGDFNHLNHMPGHTFIRMGRYKDAVDTNLAAYEAYSAEIEKGVVPYGPAHDAYLLIVAAATDGQYQRCIDHSLKLKGIYTADPDLSMTDYPDQNVGYNTLLTCYVRFAQKDGFRQVLEVEDAFDPPAPSEFGPHDDPELTYSDVLAHYARALSFVGLGKLEDARTERAELGKGMETCIERDDGEPDLYRRALHANLSQIAAAVVDARLALEEEDDAAVLTHIKAAVDQQVRGPRVAHLRAG